MRMLLSVLLAMLFLSSSLFGQDFWSGFGFDNDEPLADLNATWYQRQSLMNPYGAGSRYHPDSLMNPYGRYGSPYSNESWRNPYATEAPKIYTRDGRYMGRLSTNPYAPDSTSNAYGRYGSRFSPHSINNPYGVGGRYSTQPVYVWPRRR